MILFTKY